MESEQELARLARNEGGGEANVRLYERLVNQKNIRGRNPGAYANDVSMHIIH